MNFVRKSKVKYLMRFSTLVNHDLLENIPHKPVMVNEVLQYLKPKSNSVILDLTFGAGGHSRQILQIEPTVKIIAVDRDPVAFEFAQELSRQYPNQVLPLLGKFSELPMLLEKNDIHENSIDGILMDCGCSSMQFDISTRGFSILKNGPLDMRMDGERYPNSITAADILAKANEEDLYRILKIYGQEKQARKISRAIVDARYLFKKLTTTEELADLVDSVYTSSHKLDKLQRPTHNATKTFQALRIFVNNELNEINYGLILAHHYLKIGGRLIAITFHSLEDTIVKRHLAGNLIANSPNPLPLKYSSSSLDLDSSLIRGVMEKNWQMLHKHVQVPKIDEVEQNPRSRSAKLRAAAKVR